MHKRLLLSIDDLNDDDVGRLFFSARRMPSRFLSSTTMAHHAVVMTAFFEPSTRTRLSFELAASRLGAFVTSFHEGTSSIKKGESVFETISSLVAMAPDVLILRCAQRIDRRQFDQCDFSVINAGDGVNEHPTQALLDCLTLLDHYGTNDLKGRRVLIVGDILHSRVAHSNIKLMKILGAEVTTLAPITLCNADDAPSFSSFEDCHGRYDAVMCLRLQRERFAENLCIDEKTYFSRFGINEQRRERLGRDCVVLHPGPMNLGVEIDQGVAYGPHSLVNLQIKNGVLLRAALLDWCLS